MKNAIRILPLALSILYLTSPERPRYSPAGERMTRCAPTSLDYEVHNLLRENDGVIGSDYCYNMGYDRPLQ